MTARIGKGKKMKAVMAWGGFVGGKLDLALVDTGLGGWGRTYRKVPAVYRSKKAALEEYTDVRRVKITEVRHAK